MDARQGAAAGAPKLLPFAARRMRRQERRAMQAMQPWPQAPMAPAEPDFDEIVTQQPPRHLRLTHHAAAALFLLLLVAAALLKVDIIVAASGRLVADAPDIVLQPLQLAVVRTIPVKVGSVVRKGEIVATLDPTFAEADQTALLAERRALGAEIDRLQAEIAGTPYAPAGASTEATLQRTLFEEQRSHYASKLRAFDEDIAREEAQRTATETTRASLATQLDIARQMEDMRATLFRQQVGTRINYLDASIVRLRAERDSQDATSRLTDLDHSLQAQRAERQVFVDDWHSQLLEDLVKARREAVSLDGSLAKARRMNDLVALRAPADGIVLDVAKRSAGSVVQAGETLVTMVPSEAPLIADVAIGSADVGYARPGDPVVLKIDAFPYQRHGLLDGRLRAVAEESLAPAGSQAPSGVFHRAQVELVGTALKDLPEGARLIPGMTLSAEIKVGSRTILSYILNPVTRGLRESLREP